MKKAFYILILIVFGSCQNDKSKLPENKSNKSIIDEKDFTQFFMEVDSLLNLDNGEFWRKDIYGPIMFIDPKTRVFYSNENNIAKSFKQINSIYTDSLPTDINIANTAIDWDDKKWSMVMLPLPAEKNSRNNLIIHELFHQIQPIIGFENLQEQNNGHLDTYENRLLLKLELEALEKALNSTDSIPKLKHIQNALTFRTKRNKSQEIKNAENSLELNEGLAEYTAIMLSGRNAKELKLHLSKSKNDFYSNPTFVRSFAYQTIPFYGYLLSLKYPNWHKKVDRNINLTSLFINLFEISIDKNQSIEKITEQNNYNYQQIKKEEKKREKLRILKIEELKTRFIDEPTLELNFQNMSISFDPSNITPLENFGTIYPNLRVTDNWGILTVQNGALLAPDWSKVIVTIPTQITNKIIKGNGWKLELNPKWKVQKKGNGFKLEKEE